MPNGGCAAIMCEDEMKICSWLADATSYRCTVRVIGCTAGQSNACGRGRTKKQMQRQERQQQQR
uniref:Uncharacterized protein n=1 Tax=Anopheles arabiensis TaxID=7173 RepID=A0A182HXY4_ANOAR